MDMPDKTLANLAAAGKLMEWETENETNNINN
jgi:hypothetical protein